MKMPNNDSGRSLFAFKHWAFLALGLMTLLVLYNNERFVVFHSDADWEYFFPVRWWLLPHGLGGALALGLGPIKTGHGMVHAGALPPESTGVIDCQLLTTVIDQWTTSASSEQFPFLLEKCRHDLYEQNEKP